MREVTEDERVMRQFLLHELDLEERERIEEQFMTNDAFKEELLIAEEDLIEDYLDSSLNDADRDRFHSVFLSSPVQREKLTIARAISAQAKAEATPVAPFAEMVSGDLRLDEAAGSAQPAKSSRRSAFLLIAAAVIVAFLVVLWFLPRNPQRHESVEDKVRRLAIQAELDELNSGSRSGSQIAPAETLSLVLAPINTRASGPPNLLRRTGVGVFELWLLPTSLDKANFEAWIRKDGEGGQLEVSKLTLVDKPEGQAVRLRIPAHLFDPGAYLVELRAVNVKGDSVYAGEYRFEIAD